MRANIKMSLGASFACALSLSRRYDVAPFRAQRTSLIEMSEFLISAPSVARDEDAMAPKVNACARVA